MPSRAKVFELAKGFRGRAKNCISIARERVEKALQFAYRDRRTRQRDARSLWIQQINAGVRLYGLKYSQFVWALKEENVELNRKMLSEVARFEPKSFQVLAQLARSRVGGPASAAGAGAGAGGAGR